MSKIVKYLSLARYGKLSSVIAFQQLMALSVCNMELLRHRASMPDGSIPLQHEISKFYRPSSLTITFTNEELVMLMPLKLSI